jgi:hypothetical protein
MCERNATHRTGHFDIGKDRIDLLLLLFQYHKSGRRAVRFVNGMTFITEGLGGQISDEDLVLNDKNYRRTAAQGRSCAPRAFQERAAGPLFTVVL